MVKCYKRLVLLSKMMITDISKETNYNNICSYKFSDKFVANYNFVANRRTLQTRQLNMALDYLQSEKVVFLYGKAGEGKSTAAF